MASGTNIGSNIDTEFRLYVQNYTNKPEAYGEFENFTLNSGDWVCVGSSSFSIYKLIVKYRQVK
jgi:hypothetical protein